MSSGGMAMRARKFVVVGILLALVAAACGNSKSQSKSSTTPTTQAGVTTTTAGQADLCKFTPNPQPGVDDSKKQIRVSVITTKTNPVGGKYAQFADGIKAYFSMVNSQCGGTGI